MAEPAILVRGVKKSYGSGETAVPVLRGVDMTVAAGEFVAVLGPSGSGKSTLLNLLGLMDRPDEGEQLANANAPEAHPEPHGMSVLDPAPPACITRSPPAVGRPAPCCAAGGRSSSVRRPRGRG